MNKIKRIGIVGVLTLALSLSISSHAMAALTLGAATVGGSGALTLSSVGANLTLTAGTAGANAVVITGNASGTDALILTKGDILISEGLFDMTVGDMTLADGSITLTDADNANSITVVNNTITTADLADVSSTSISTGALAKLNANTAAHDGEVLEIISAGDTTATPVGLSVSIPSVTTGAARGIDVTMVGLTTTGFGIKATMDAITTGDMLYLDNGGATMTGDGKFINCNDDDTSKFSVSADGATVIAGNASGTDALTLTKGDILISEGLFDMTVGDMTLADGSLTLTDADNANSITVVNNTITTADLADVSSTSISSGALAKLNANTAAHDGEVLEIISAGDATATPKGVTVTIPDVTTGAAKGIDIVMAGATTGPIGLDITMAALTTSAAINVTANAATTTTGVVRVSATGQTTGNVLLLTGGGTTLASGGAVISADMGAATAGSGLEIVTTGDYVDLADGLINVTANTATAGNLVITNATSITTGTGLLVTGSAVGTMTNAGSYFRASDGTTDVFRVGTNGHLISDSVDGANGEPALTVTGTSFTVTAETAGNGAGTATDTRGQVSLHAHTGVGTAIITFGVAYATAPVCVISPANAAAQVNQIKTYVTTSASAMTINYIAGATAGDDLWNYICIE